MARRNRHRIAVEGDQPALWPQLRQHRTAVPAAAEGSVHVNTRRLDGQRLDCLFQQHRDMRSRAHSGRFSQPAGRSSAPRAKIASCCFCQPASDQSSK